MVVVDSSALIPLAWVGRLDLLHDVFDDVRTTSSVEDEVVVEGKRGSGALDRFLDDVEIQPAPDSAAAVASMEGIAETDAAVVLLAESIDTRLLANDRALIDVGRSHDVDCWWVTTLLLHCVKTDVLDADEATDVLYDLVDAGMNLSPQVYVRVQDRLESLGE